MKNLFTESNYHLIALDEVAGYRVRPGFYEINGATAIPGGVNFTIHSNQATSCELLLYHRMEGEPYAILPFPRHYRIGNVYSMIIFGLNIEEFEYAYRMDGPYEPQKGIFFDKTKILLDPYAKAVTGQSVWGRKVNGLENQYHGRVVKDDFDWGDFKNPLTPSEDTIIYELHVRGFTKDTTSGVTAPGTFAGILEKLPYLKELGITAVELMPIFEFDELQDSREYGGSKLFNYWGYSTVSFFAPNTSFTAGLEYNQEGNELKQLIKTLKMNDIEVYLDVVFNHTAEGNENGPFFSFKGIDNNIYYMLTPDGQYFNFSGCGNTLNCNHPIVQQMIIECLRYWVITYRVDGFRFDLASILGRNEDGSPMSKPPLLQSLAFDPILGNVKLIAEAWDAGGLYQVGTFPSWNRWMEWNGRYRDDMRAFLKGDSGKAKAAAERFFGSQDIYTKERLEHCAAVNFITCHDGFTLHDLYTYNSKHNENNGWDNTDGADDNQSWNCGTEGETEDAAVNKLRRRMVKNAAAVLLCSRGIPMFLSGDEFGNTSFGNNNPYCQDNIISWLDWSLLKQNQELYTFFKYMIAFRKQHDPIRKPTEASSLGFPEYSAHDVMPWESDYMEDAHYIGLMFAGKTGGKDDVIYIAVNSYWENLTVKLPQLPKDMRFRLVVNTYEENSIYKKPIYVENSVLVRDRTVMIFIAENFTMVRGR